MCVESESFEGRISLPDLCALIKRWFWWQRARSVGRRMWMGFEIVVATLIVGIVIVAVVIRGVVGKI